jgi:hypothetical protein
MQNLNEGERIKMKKIKRKLKMKNKKERKLSKELIKDLKIDREVSMIWFHAQKE